MAANETNTEVGTAIGSGISPLSGGNMLEMLLGLIVVVAVIFICAWLFKRVGGLQGSMGGMIKITAGLSLGSRDRLALIEVGEQKILLGISPGRINTLHVFDQDPLSTEQNMSSSTHNPSGMSGTDNSHTQNFASKLQTLLSKQDSNNE